MDEISALVFFVNGKKVTDNNVDPQWTLLYYLRNKLNIRGTKLGCSEGGCGACTVMVSKYDRKNKKPNHYSVNACLAPVCSMHGLAVTTIEGIGSTKTRLHPVQERIAKAHGSQCGFCTPGIVMSMYTLLRNMPNPNMADLEETFQGNLCRCTGYRPIIEGYKTFTKEFESCMGFNDIVVNENGVCGKGDKCCKNMKKTDAEELFNSNEFIPYDKDQEPIFPPELILNDSYDGQYLTFKSNDVVWYRPMSLNQLLKLKKTYPDSRLVIGNTEVGVEVKARKINYPVLIQPTFIKELTDVTITDEGLKIGASVTLHEIDILMRQQILDLPEHKTRVFKAIVDMLHWFAGKQIRNVASVGGNIMTGSPISDLNPIFMAAECELELMNLQGVRTVLINKDFYTGYRTNIVQKDEILVSVNVPYTHEDQYFCAFKQSKRRDDDIAIVNMAMYLELESSSNKIKDIRLSFGGMAPTTVMAKSTRNKLIGKEFNENMFKIAYDTLLEDFPLSANAPGGMVQYRSTLTLSLFYKAYITLMEKYRTRFANNSIPIKERSGAKQFEYKCPESSQFFSITSKEQKYDTVGKPIVHLSAYKQATGEALYCDDIPKSQNELYLAFVLTTKANANILSVDPSVALAMPGVHAFFSSKDLTEEQNSLGTIFHDEEIFVTKMAHCCGQVIGVIIAEDQLLAQKAASKVKIEYEQLQPIIISIEDAIREKSFFPEYPKILTHGDVDEAFKNADHVIEGQCRTGAQEHFYLETHCALVVPKQEDDEIEIYASSQNPTELSTYTSRMLGIPINRIVSKVKRIGGGFGGKESKVLILVLPTALAAHRLRRPVRCMLDRDEDMVMTAYRNPFMMKYKTAFTKEGKITACEIEIYINSGFSYDLSPAVLDRGMFHFQNSYNIPNVKVLGYLCRTNLPSNTAFRGFGAPQAMFAAENMIRNIAETLNKSQLDICRLNLYKEGDITHYNQTLNHCTLSRCLEECVERSDYHNRMKVVQEFNRQNRWRKRGFSIVPTAYGIAFTVLFLNQAGALIHVYTDGSVLLTHGGVEMGQGLHTKTIQIASKVLGIPTSKIHLSETSTDKVPNTSSTAASLGSDMNGMAVMKACESIMDRLQPFIEKNPKGKWEDWISAAYFDRVSLSATGFYKTPLIGFDWKTKTGDVFSYYTFGVGCSEVEVDILTGDHKVLRTDIVMDVGESLNPAIDIGQIEGAFMQGYGLFTIEEVLFSPTGATLTKGPGAYKLPGFADIPTEFNVALLKGAPNPRAVYSSKAVGEPPLFLASSVLFAIREAIKSARSDAGVTENFTLDAPATAAKIRMACADHLTAKVPALDTNVKAWNVVP